MTTLPSILCIGVDVTWWGGSPKNRQTQLETIVSACPHDPDSFAIDTRRKTICSST